MAETGVLCLGHLVLDTICYVDALPTRPVKHRANAAHLGVGGNAANAAIAVARLGGRASLAARAGDDAAWSVVRARLCAEGVDLDWVRVERGRATSVSAILIDAAGERLIVNHGDAALDPSAAGLPRSLRPEQGAVLADLRWPQAIPVVFALARAAGRPAVLDADSSAPFDVALLSGASHVVFAADTLRRATGCDDLGAALAAVARTCGGLVMVTDGPRGVWWRDDAGLAHRPAFPVAAVDTLGAGDVFHGAFALALTEGRPVADAARFASAAAALKCLRRGGGEAAPARTEVEAFLAGA